MKIDIDEFQREACRKPGWRDTPARNDLMAAFADAQDAAGASAPASLADFRPTFAPMDDAVFEAMDADQLRSYARGLEQGMLYAQSLLHGLKR